MPPIDMLNATHRIASAIINSISGVVVTALDLSRLSFEEQYRIVSGVGIIVGMHGAQMMHMFHASIGRPNCCAVVEIFPISEQGALESAQVSFHRIQIFGNLARHLGISYSRYEADGENEQLTVKGTRIDTHRLVLVVRQAVTFVRDESSCIAV